LLGDAVRFGHDLLAELRSDDRKETAAIVDTANAWFAGCRIGARNMLSDNGFCYRYGPSSPRNQWRQQLGFLLSPSRRFGGQE
jgi:hypothetical protein